MIINAIAWVLLLVLILLAVLPLPTFLFWLCLGGVILLTSWTQGAAYAAAIAIYRGDEVGVLAAYRAVWGKRLFYLIATGVLVLVGTVLGFLLLIIPGILFVLRYGLVYPAVVVVEGIGGLQAFRRCWEITRGQTLRVAILVIIFGMLEGGTGYLLGNSPEMKILLQLVFAPIGVVWGTLFYFAALGQPRNFRQNGLALTLGHLIGGVCFLALVLFLPPKTLVQAFKIPAESMKTTLLVGDHFLVNKFLYRQTSPKRLDIIVFQYPWEADRVFIKRVIGLPGDRVHMRDRQVFVNDQPLQEPYARYTASLRQENFGPVVVPRKEDRIEIRNDTRLYLNGAPLPIPSNPYHPSGLFQPRKDGVPLTGLEVFYGAMLPPNTTLQQALEPRVVQQDYYFVLGDNRDNSQDSRYWGFVPRAGILGAAQRIYWSWDPSARRVRWERIGQEIR